MSERRTWTCCGRLRRTPWCPDCGKEKPPATPTVEAEEIIDEWRRIASSQQKRAHTLDNRAETIACEHDLNEVIKRDKGTDAEELGYATTYACEVSRLQGMASAAQKRADKYSRWIAVFSKAIGTATEVPDGK